MPDPVAGAPCAVGTRVLTNEPTVTIPGPSSPAQQVVENTPAEGEPQISGIPEVGQTLSADTTAIADADGLENAVFQYQWLAEDADISGATGTTYTVVSGDVGQAIRVRVTFTDDAGHEETLTSAPTVVTAGLQLQSATVNGTTLTLTYSEVLDTGVTLGTTPFAVSVNGSSRLLIAVGVGESNVLLLLSSAVEAGDTVIVYYTVPDGPDFIRDIRGRKAASFSGQAVANDTASVPLTASAHDAPSSHNGQDAFTFELRFSEDPKPDLSYATVRDHAFTVTGGSVTYVRRLDPPSNIRWEITVTPGSGADVTIALNATTDCSAQGAICTEEGGKLSGGLQLAVPGPNTPATGLPTITGAARVGETLTADTTGISDDDGLGNAAFAYQWLADDAEIDSATASSYTLVAADAGKAIKMRVSFTDDAGNDEQLTSTVTGAVAAAPPLPNTPATGLPTITGAAQVGETLTADTTGISDDDGLGNAAFAYQWLADDAEINGANASTYTLADDDEGKAIKVKVSFTDDAGNDDQLTSAGTGAVAPAPPPPNTPATGLPTITGTAQVGETLTADTTGISDDDGLGNAAFAYQWLADDAEIDSATASSYTLVAADAGKAINVRVSFTDDAGNGEELTSAGTGAVAAAPPPPNTPATGLPTITGTAQVGETLTADTTGISDDDGLGNAAFAYQWLADDAEIDSATASSYTLVAADAGKAINVKVSFTDDAGNDEELTSAGTGAVAAAPPLSNNAATGAPTITGAAQVGETLTADTTGISDDDGLGNAAFAYQWLADDAEINEANASTYTLADDDEGKAIKVRVSFTDDAGNDEDLTSAATGAVAPAVVNPPLTASAQNVPSSHDGSATFIFELRFSEDPKPDLSYATVRDHAFTVTGGSVTYVRRLDPPSNIRWEITVTPGSGADVTIALNATTDCSAQGAICTEEGGKLSGGLQLAVPGPNTPATGLPTITGAAQVGDTLTAVTSGIEDADGLDNAAFAYQWLADDAEIDSATASSYTLVAADAGKVIKVRVSFTDDAGNDEQLTSAGTGAVAAAPPPPNTPATGLPTITGTAQVGETLTADTTGISDDDGLDNAAFAYQWLADDAEIDSATASSYTLVAADAGKAIKVKGVLHRRRRQRRGAHQRRDGRRGRGSPSSQHPGHRVAHHNRHRPGGRDPHRRHHRHIRRRRPRQRCLRLPVARRRRRDRQRHRQQLHPCCRRRGQGHQREGLLHRRRRQRRAAHQRRDGRRGRGSSSSQHPGHRVAHHHRHRPGWGHAYCGYLRHRRRRRPRQRCLRLPVARRRRRDRQRHRQQLHPGRRRRGQGHQSEGLLHRRRRQRRAAHQRRDGRRGAGSRQLAADGQRPERTVVP